MTRDTLDMFERKERGRFGDNESAPRQRVTGASDIIDIECTFRSERPLSLAVSKLGTMTWIWLPKSLIEFERKGTSVTVSLPEYVAKEKGLV